jgi:hypothetical protein
MLTHLTQEVSNNCKLFQYDQKPELLKNLRKINGDFHQATIGKSSNLSGLEYSVKDLLALHDNYDIELLKVDIEGEPGFLEIEIDSKVPNFT